MPDSDEMNTKVPAPRAAMPGASARASTTGARRLTSSVRSICASVNSSSGPLAGSAALATSTSTSPGLPRSAARRRPGAPRSRRPVPAPRSAASGSSTSARRPVRIICAPGRERPRDRMADPAVGAGDEHRFRRPCAVSREATRREHGDGGGEAMQEAASPDRADLVRRRRSQPRRPAELPLEHARRRGRNPEHRLPAAVAREHERAGGRLARPSPRPARRAHARSRWSAERASRACSRTTWPAGTCAPTTSRPSSESAPRTRGPGSRPARTRACRRRSRSRSAARRRPALARAARARR